MNENQYLVSFMCLSLETVAFILNVGYDLNVAKNSLNKRTQWRQPKTCRGLSEKQRHCTLEFLAADICAKYHRTEIKIPVTNAQRKSWINNFVELPTGTYDITRWFYASGEGLFIGSYLLPVHNLFFNLSLVWMLSRASCRLPER